MADQFCRCNVPRGSCLCLGCHRPIRDTRDAEIATLRARAERAEGDRATLRDRVERAEGTIQVICGMVDGEDPCRGVQRLIEDSVRADRYREALSEAARALHGAAAGMPLAATRIAAEVADAALAATGDEEGKGGDNG